MGYGRRSYSPKSGALQAENRSFAGGGFPQRLGSVCLCCVPERTASGSNSRVLVPFRRSPVASSVRSLLAHPSSLGATITGFFPVSPSRMSACYMGCGPAAQQIIARLAGWVRWASDPRGARPTPSGILRRRHSWRG
jgi:hypothetical protein